jgi:biotin carboxylase
VQRLLLLVPTTTYRAGAFVRAAQRLDIDLTLVSEEPSALEEYQPVALVSLDFTNLDAAAERMRDFAREHPIHAVLAVDDQVTVAAAVISAAVDLPHNPVDAVAATRNKHAMRDRLSARGVPQPGYRLHSVDDDAATVAADMRYPCVIKPLMMSASRGVIRANSPREFADAFAKVITIIAAPDAPDDEMSQRHILIEDYVPGWEVAVEGILTDGELHVFAIFDKPDPLEGPYFPETIYVTPSRLPRAVQSRIVDVTCDAARAIGLVHGPIHAELRGSNDDLWFIEIAARSIGGYCSRVLHFHGDLSLEDVIVRHALGQLPSLPERERAAAGVMMLQAPHRGVFKEARGLEHAKATPNVDEIIISAHPDQSLSPLPEGFLYVGFLFARGATPAAVEDALREAHARLDIVIEHHDH